MAGVFHGDHVVDLTRGDERCAWHGVVVDLVADKEGEAGWIRVNWMHDPHHRLADFYTAKQIKERWCSTGDEMTQWEIVR